MEFPEHRSVGARVRAQSTQEFLTTVVGEHDVEMLSRDQTTVVVDGGRRFNCAEELPVAFAGHTTNTSLMVQAAHQAFACHLGFGLRPEVVWYAIVSEISEHIRQNIADYRELLGPGWQYSPRTVRVYWTYPEEVFGCFYAELSKVIGAKLSALFVPKLTTVDEEARIALIAAYMEAAGPYHSYQIPTLCGIRRIKIEGEAADWLLMRNNVSELQEFFPPLYDYLEGVWQTLHNIYCTIAGMEINLGTFWEDLYKWHDGGSGGPHIQGWITNLFAHRRTKTGAKLRADFMWWNRAWNGFELGDFASHVSSVPILRTGSSGDRQQHLVTGILGMEHTDDSNGQVPLLTPRLGWGIITKH